MISIELDIYGKDVPACYLMGAGEIEALFIQLPSGDLVDMSDLLDFDHIYKTIEDHYHNMMRDAQVCH